MGTHACCRFRDEDHRRAVLRRFFEEGIAKDQRIAYFGRDRDDPRLADYVGSTPLTRDLLASGQLLVGSSVDAYPQGDAFDGYVVVAQFEGLVRRSLDDGYAGMRVFADNGWLPERLPTTGHWIRYELLVTQMVARYPLFGLCGFSHDDPATLSFDVVDALHEMTYPDGVAPVRVGVKRDRVLSVVGSCDAKSTRVLEEVLDAAAGAWQVVDMSALRFADGVAGDDSWRRLHHSMRQAAAAST